jgi:hypothetical protein
MADANFSVCVFCGSRSGTNPAYEAAAHDVGHLIATRGWRLVYGAGDIGLMGAVAKAAQAAEGATFGVIPVHLMQKEVAKRNLGRLVVTENMHERKKVMFMNSNAIVVLPGGAGSLDEFFEVLTWRQIGLHQKPIFLLNTEGYWDKLIALLDHVIEQGFADASLKESVQTVSDPGALATALESARS